MFEQYFIISYTTSSTHCSFFIYNNFQRLTLKSLTERHFPRGGGGLEQPPTRSCVFRRGRQKARNELNEQWNYQHLSHLSPHRSYKKYRRIETGRSSSKKQPFYKVSIYARLLSSLRRFFLLLLPSHHPFPLSHSHFLSFFSHPTFNIVVFRKITYVSFCESFK